MWHIAEFESEEVPEASLGQFFSTDSYVIRWQYSISYTGNWSYLLKYTPLWWVVFIFCINYCFCVRLILPRNSTSSIRLVYYSILCLIAGRELSGLPSKHTTVGRDRCVYFCWQGKNASLNEQGAAALLTVELDKEKGIQLRTCQGYEPPAFFNLFKGRTVIYRNKSSSKGRYFNYSLAVFSSIQCPISGMRSTKKIWNKLLLLSFLDYWFYGFWYFHPRSCLWQYISIVKLRFWTIFIVLFTDKEWKLFICRGEIESEAVLLEVSCNIKQLRSRAAFVLLNVATGTSFLWHGCKVTKTASKVSWFVSENLKYVRRKCGERRILCNSNGVR